MPQLLAFFTLMGVLILSSVMAGRESMSGARSVQVEAMALKKECEMSLPRTESCVMIYIPNTENVK